MEITIHEDKKIVSIWLTNAEQEDSSITARLNLLIAKYRDANYTVAVFKSGKKDLFQCTVDLCRYNRMREAVAEGYRERMAPTPRQQQNCQKTYE